MNVMTDEKTMAVSGAGGAPATAANTIGAAIIVGAISGIPLGPWGMIGNAALAGTLTGIGMINNQGPVFRRL